MSTLPGIPSPPEHWPALLGIDRLSIGEIGGYLDSARSFARGERPTLAAFSACLLFLQPSLRTRLGFATAVELLGGRAYTVDALRDTPGTTAPESLTDTIRIASGMVDILIVRAGCNLAEYRGHCHSALVNAGDNSEHPTQALADLFAMETIGGPIDALSVGLCGDLNMRAARSLLRILALFPPRALRLIAPDERRGDALELVAPLGSRVEWTPQADWSGLDVLYLVGLPESRNGHSLDQSQRAQYAFQPNNQHLLPRHASIFSPMPVIDEIDPALRSDARVRIYEQSDLSNFMRQAVIYRMVRQMTR